MAPTKPAKQGKAKVATEFDEIINAGTLILQGVYPFGQEFET